MELPSILCIYGEIIIPGCLSYIRVGYEPFTVDWKLVLGHTETESAGHIKLARQSPQYHCRANCLNRSVTILQATVHDGSNTTRSCDSSCKRPDRFSRNAGDTFYNLRPKVLNIAVKIIKTYGPSLDKFLLVEFLLNNDIAQPQSQRSVRAWTDWNPLRIGVFGHHRFSRVNHYYLSASPVCLLNPIKVVRRTVRCRILSPNHNEFSVFNIREHVNEHTAHRNMGRYHRK